MKRNKLHTNQASRSLTGAIMTGVFTAVILSVLLSVLLANLVLKGRLSEESAYVITFGIRSISILVGALMGGLLLKEKYPLQIGSIALSYMLVLLATGILFYNGSFKHFLSGAASVLIGGAVAILILLRPKSNVRRTVKFNR